VSDAGDTRNADNVNNPGADKPDTLDGDTIESPRSEDDTRALQDNDISESAAVEDDIDENAINNLPGTGGPDDFGDIEVDPDELNL